MAVALFARTNFWNGLFSGVGMIGGGVGVCEPVFVIRNNGEGDSFDCCCCGCVKLVRDFAFFNTSLMPMDGGLEGCVLGLLYTIPILPPAVARFSNSFFDLLLLSPPLVAPLPLVVGVLTLRTITCGCAILFVTSSSLSSSSLGMMVGLLLVRAGAGAMVFLTGAGPKLIVVDGGRTETGVGVFLLLLLSGTVLLASTSSGSLLFGRSKFIARGAIDVTEVILGVLLTAVVITLLNPGVLRAVLGELVITVLLLLFVACCDTIVGCVLGKDDDDDDEVFVGCTFGCAVPIKLRIDDSIVGGSSGTFRGEKGLDKPAEANEADPDAAASSLVCSLSILSTLALLLPLVLTELLILLVGSPLGL